MLKSFFSEIIFFCCLKLLHLEKRSKNEFFTFIFFFVCALKNIKQWPSFALFLKFWIGEKWNLFCTTYFLCFPSHILILLSVRHHKPLLIKSLSWMQAIHKDRIFWKNLIKNKEMVFGNGVKNIQAPAYNGARTVNKL